MIGALTRSLCNTAGLLLLAVALLGCSGEEGPSEDADTATETAPTGPEAAETDDDSDEAPTGPEAAETEDDSDEAPTGPGTAETDEAAEPSLREFEVFFTNLDLGGDTEVHPVSRSTARSDVLTAALEELVAGPTEDERAEGYFSWFSQETAGVVESVAIVDGVARISFDAALPSLIPNASTSAGSLMLLGALDATAEQFPTVDRAVYALEGDVPAFYEWLQLSPPG